MNDPVEQTFEAQTFQTQRELLVRAVGQTGLVQPDPQVAKDQSQPHEQQSQVRLSRAGHDAGLPHLTVTGLDAEAQAVVFADRCRSSRHTPRREQHLLLHAATILPIPMSAIRYEYRNRRRPFAILEGVGVTARRLTLERVQAGAWTSLLRRPAAEHHRHQEGEFFGLQPLDHGNDVESAVQQQTADFQLDFANSRQQPLQHDHRRFVPPDPRQSQRGTDSVLHDAGGRVGVKLRRPGLRLAVVQFVAALVRLAVIRLQMPVDDDVPLLPSYPARQWTNQEHLVEPPLAATRSRPPRPNTANRDPSATSPALTLESRTREPRDSKCYDSSLNAWGIPPGPRRLSTQHSLENPFVFS